MKGGGRGECVYWYATDASVKALRSEARSGMEPWYKVVGREGAKRASSRTQLPRVDRGATISTAPVTFMARTAA